MAKSPDAFRTISEVADWLDTPAHVLRFWESKFSQVKPVKRAGGRRYYRPEDMALLGGIKKLLHDDGMTIKGVQKLLREQGVRHVGAMAPALPGEDAAIDMAPSPKAEDAPRSVAQDAPGFTPPAAEADMAAPAAAPETPEAEEVVAPATADEAPAETDADAASAETQDDPADDAGPGPDAAPGIGRPVRRRGRRRTGPADHQGRAPARRARPGARCRPVGPDSAPAAAGRSPRRHRPARLAGTRPGRFRQQGRAAASCTCWRPPIPSACAPAPPT